MPLDLTKYTPRQERRGRLPEALRALLRDPETLADGSKVYEAVIMRRAVLEFGPSRVLRSDSALAALSRSGRLEGLPVKRGPAHPRMILRGGIPVGFEKVNSSTIGTITRSRYDTEHGALIGRIRVWSEADQSTVERELDGVSLGYLSQDDPTGGTDDTLGEYDVEVVEIVPDHLVTTNYPRGGDDAALRIETQETVMPKVNVRGQEMDAAQVEAQFQTYETQIQAAQTQAGERATLQARVETLEGENKVLKAGQKSKEEDTAFQARLKLVSEAAPILKVKAETLATEDPDVIKRRVLTSFYGESFGAATMEGPALDGAYRAAMAQAPGKVREVKEQNALTNQPRIETKTQQQTQPRKDWLSKD